MKEITSTHQIPPGKLDYGKHLTEQQTAVAQIPFPNRISSAPRWRMRTPNSTPPRSSTALPSRRIRRDGWTTDRQVKFIIALNKTSSVTRAAAAAGMSRENAYRLRDRPGHTDFARAWNAAVARKGHKSPAESHTRGRPVTLDPSREDHESHAAGGFAQHCQARQFRAAPAGFPGRPNRGS